MVTTRSSTTTSFVKKSAPIVAIKNEIVILYVSTRKTFLGCLAEITFILI